MSLEQFVSKGARFAVIGAIGTAINLAILYGLTNFVHVYYLYSELISIIIVFAFNYIGNIMIGNIRIDGPLEDGTRRPSEAAV